MKEQESIATVSVVMATYNGEKFLREQLDSILAQTYPIHEIIIQDDCSSDGSVDIIKEYSLKCPIIKLEINESNIGFNLNFRKAVSRSSGEYIALSDQDDIWCKDKIYRQMSAIKDRAMCYCYHLRGKNEQESHLVNYKCAPERQLFDAIVGHSMLLRGDFARNPDNWMTMVNFDFGLGINAHLQGGVTVVKEPLVFHRLHNSEVTYMETPMSYSPWYPYIWGFRNFFRMKKSTRYVSYYTTVLDKSSGKNELVHELCKLMLSRAPWNLFCLQIICMKHRDTICPNNANVIRGFFHPLIYATYHNWSDDYHNNK